MRDTKGHILSQNTDISRGKFSVVSEVYDTYEVCFTSKVLAGHDGVVLTISLNTKKGVEAKSYEGVSTIFLHSLQNYLYQIYKTCR